MKFSSTVKDFDGFKEKIQPLLEKATLTIPKPKIYQELETQGKVFFTNYDMVQMEIE